MFCMTNGPLAWIKIAKNACSSWQTALEKDGWKLENLSDYQGRWHEKIWIGFLRDPGVRHTMGVAQFLEKCNLEKILYDPEYAKIVCSLLMDEHTYSVHHMVPYELIQQTNWFVIDHKYFDYEDLTRRFCKRHGIKIPDIPKLNQSSQRRKEMQYKIDEIKAQNSRFYGSVMKNYLERDVFLYARADFEQSKFDI
jgi:hypothetical protein